jgi:hypothetical protein
MEYWLEFQMVSPLDFAEDERMVWNSVTLSNLIDSMNFVVPTIGKNSEIVDVPIP